MNQPNPAQQQAGSPLESRYRRLLWAYPGDYRIERGDEIVGTYLDTVGPGRRWPSPHDALDLLGGGLRERLRGYGALGLAAGFPLAATAALSTLVAVAAFLLLQVEFEDPRFARLDPVGPFQTLGAVIWLGWLVVGLAATTLPGSWARTAAAGGLLLTIAVPPVAAVIGQPGPPLFVLVPTVALGLVTLALPSHPGWVARSLPPLTAGCVTAASVAFSAAENGGNMFTSYGSTPELLAMAGGSMVALVLLVGLGRAAASRRRRPLGGAAARHPGRPARRRPAQPGDLGYQRRRTHLDGLRRHGRVDPSCRRGAAGSGPRRPGRTTPDRTSASARQRLPDLRTPLDGNGTELTSAGSVMWRGSRRRVGDLE